MLDRDLEGAKASFNAVYQQVPGELAPKLALAVACERGGLPQVAERLYITCASTDAAFIAAAAFGVARIRAERRDASAAVEALDWVPRTSRGYPESRQLRAEVLLGQGTSDLRVLDQAMTSIESASMDATTQGRYTVRILEQGLAIVQGGGGVKKATIGSYEADEVGLRAGLERAYRLLARDAQALPERIELVNRANAVRTWSLT